MAKEAKPEEGSEEEGSTDPNAEGTPSEQAQEGQKWWEVRGFKSEEEAINALDEGSRTITELQEQRANQERVIGGLMQGGGAGATQPPAAPAGTPAEVPGYRRYYEGLNFAEAYQDPQAYADALMTANERMVRQVTAQVVQGYSQARELRQQFFKDNPDLEPFDEIVRIATNEVYARNPSMRLKEGMQEIAKVARQKIVAIRGGKAPAPTPNQATAGQLPHTGGGTSEGDAPKGEETSPKKEEAAKTPEQEVADAIKSRVASRQKKIAAS